MEAVIPVGYSLCYLMAYYGPNKAILGNVAESDVEKTMQMTGLLFLLDVSSLLVSSTLLWVFCKINLFKIYLRSQQSAAGGIDMTFQFNWLKVIQKYNTI